MTKLFTIRRTAKAQALRDEAEKTITKNRVSMTQTDVFLYALAFLVRYFDFVAKNHPDFKGQNDAGIQALHDLMK